jgi:hypothetical protein
MSDPEEVTPEMIDVYPCELSRAAQPITEPVTKIGGAPVFLQQMEWPQCGNCGRDMGFLAQIRLDEPIRFSDRYAMAYVFVCPYAGEVGCYPWDAASGANAVILHSLVGNEVIIVTPDEKLQTSEVAFHFQHSQEPFVETYLWKEESGVHSSTKIGGVPVWVQNDETPTCTKCHEPMMLLAQIDEYAEGMQEFYASDTGLAYIFICVNDCGPHQAVYLAQSM